MTSLLSRLLFKSAAPAPIAPGLYHTMAPQDVEKPYRLHLRIEPDGSGILIVNAATVLHLNRTAAAHAYEILLGSSEEQAARTVASRFRVSAGRALGDQQRLRDQIMTIATTPELDPVFFLGVDRREPYGTRPSAPYRVDLALTYRSGPGGALDPLARKRVDRELTTDEWKRVLTTAWEAGIPHVTFTGGEPTLRPDLVDLVAHAESLGQVTGLLTDTRRLADRAYMQALSQAGLDHILAAVEPGDRASMEGLREALASDVFTAAHLTLTPKEADQAKPRIRELTDLGVRTLSLSASENRPDLAKRLAEAREEAARLGLDLIWDLAAPYSAINPISLELEAPRAPGGRTCLYVEPDGDVLPAQGVDRVLGNVLRDAWLAMWSVAAE